MIFLFFFLPAQKQDADVILFTGTTKHAISIMDTGNGNITSTINHGNPIAVDYDPISKRVYWSDVASQVIQSATLNGENQTTVKQLSSESVPDGLAVDAISRLIIYTDAGKGTINVIAMEGLYHKIIISEHLNKPRDIEVDAINGVIYWTDWGKSPYIGKARYDGTGFYRIIDTGLQWPNGLAVDVTGNRIYWCDGGTRKIESSALDGTDRRVLLTEAHSHYFGLSVHGNDLYFTDWGRTGVRYMTTRGSNITNVGGTTGRLNDVQVMKSLLEEGLGFDTKNRCSDNKGGCSEICLPKPGREWICACSDDSVLQRDGSSCKESKFAL